MKTLRLFVLLFCLSISQNSFAQEGVIFLNGPIAATTSVEKHIFTDCSLRTETTNYYYPASSIVTGSESWSSYDSDNKCYDQYYSDYITCYKFALTVPANAIITNIKIQTGSGGEGYIVETPTNLFSLSAEDKFNTVKGGASICTFPTSNPVADNWIDITSYASQFRANGFFTLGAYSNKSKSYNPNISCQVWYKIPASITFKNNMGGQFSVNGVDKYGPFSNDYWLSTNISLSVNEPQYATNPNYTWIWNDTEAPLNPSKWNKYKNNSLVSQRSEQSFSFSVTVDDHGATYEANMKKICNVDFKNNLVGFSSYGSVTVNGTSYNSPTAQFQVVEQNAISVSATQMYYNINGITYYFSQWNDGSTASSRTIYPGASNSYTANYTGIPTSTPMNITLNYSESSQPVRISWNDHPNVNVTQYKVYRGAKVEGNFTNPVVLATLNRGTTSYTDYSYTVGGSNPGSVAYDVVPYYATEGTWGYVGQNIITASPGGARISDNALAQSQTTATEIPTEYSIGNFPNPFNPATTIKYQLPEAGMVMLKVYDILGREVAELVNETKSAGYYEVNFDASRLTSGVYIYTIQSGKYTESKKMILTK